MQQDGPYLLQDLQQTANAPVAEQYEQWIYPEPIEDLEAYSAKGFVDGSAPKFNHWLYWPDGRYLKQHQESLDILIAGCGANAAARYAYQHPKSRVVGIDLSQASLAHERHLKDKYQLDNLTLHQLRIEDVQTLGKTFDLVESVGVLHHLPNPLEGIKALKSVLSPDGVMVVMLYAMYGRVGTYMLQDLFERVGLRQTSEDIAVIKQTLEILNDQHPVQSYTKHNADMDFEAGLVDSFLHPIDRPYTVTDCLRLVDDAGLAFQGWVDPFHYYPEGQIGVAHPLYSRITSLPEPEMWQAMELFYGHLTQHMFMACHPERDPKTYQLPAAGSPAFLNLKPVLRVHQVIPSEPDKKLSAVLHRAPFAKIPLSKAQEFMVFAVDKHRTIAEIAQLGFKSRTEPEWSAERWQQAAVVFFNNLWRIGFGFLQL